MTANFRKPGLLYPNQSAPLPSPAPFTARFRTPARRAQTPVRRSTREYRKAIRAAELAAWEAVLPSAAAQLRAQAADAAKASPAEERLFTMLMALSLAGIVWGLADSVRFVEGWQQFVALVRQLIG